MRREPATVVRAEWIGQRAASLLARPGRSGEVLAVVSGVVYLGLLGPAREILWLAPEGAPLHRRCITASFRPEAVEPGLKFTSHDGYLQIGPELIVDLGQAARWEPAAFLQDRCPPLATVNKHFRNIFSVIRCLPSRGLGRALELILYPEARGAPSRDAIWLDQALPALHEVAQACQARDMAMALKSGLRLVGLGPGLTPSGDDYLGGLLFTARYLRAAYPWEFRWDRGLILNFLGPGAPADELLELYDSGRPSQWPRPGATPRTGQLLAPRGAEAPFPERSATAYSDWPQLRLGYASRDDDRSTPSKGGSLKRHEWGMIMNVH
jgi:hypothetical protein